jgi:hypothetical protein
MSRKAVPVVLSEMLPNIKMQKTGAEDAPYANAFPRF